MTNKKENNAPDFTYLAVNKGYYNSGLKPIEILIMSQVDEYLRNTGECYVTNEQFATYFNVSLDTIKRTLDKLEEKEYIERNTKMSKDNGQASRTRTIKHGKAYTRIQANQMMLA